MPYSLRTACFLIPLGLLIGGITSFGLEEQTEAVFPAFATIDSTAVRKYIKLLEAQYVRGLEGVGAGYRIDRAEILPVMPPDPAMTLSLSGGLVVIKKGDFPSSFFADLPSATLNGVTVYPVTVRESPITRETIFLNKSGKKIAALPPARNYDPYAWLKSSRPDLFSGSYAPEYVAWMKALYDPARVRVTYNLLSWTQIEAMANAQAQADILAEQAIWTGMTMSMTEPSPTNLIIRAITPGTNGAILEVAWPDDFSNRVEIYMREQVAPTGWIPISDPLDTLGSNPLFWTDTTTAGADLRFYRVGNADLDADSDGLTDARERMTFGTCETNTDTDADALTDGVEALQTGTNPLNPDTDSDELTDGVEVLGYGTNPLVPDTDTDGLTDGQEVNQYHSQPLVPDTDGDMLSDGQEVLLRLTDPLNPDTDSDGLTDGEEVLPNVSDPLMPDTDMDTIGDRQELIGLAAWHIQMTNACDWVEPGAGAQWITNWPEGSVSGGFVDSAFAAPLAASIRMGDFTGTSIRVSSDGLILIDSAAPSNAPPPDVNQALPADGLGALLAVFWDDLCVSSSTGVWMAASGTGNTARVIVTWVGASVNGTCGQDEGLDVQCEYRADTRAFTFRYRQAAGKTFPLHALCTIGVQGGAPFSLARVVFNQPGIIQPHTSIILSPSPSDPRNTDSDTDGWQDGREADLGMNPGSYDDPDADADGDGLSLAQEAVLGTDPLNIDTDGDGFTDGQEYEYQMDPLSPDDPAGDDDQDGLTNWEEWSRGTNPELADTDGDGITDWHEAMQGSDPLDFSDFGAPPEETVEVEMFLNAGVTGDPFRAGGTVFQMGQYQLRRPPGATGTTAAFVRVAKGRLYEMSVFSLEGVPQESPVTTSFQIDGMDPVPLPGMNRWLAGSVVIDSGFSVVGTRKTGTTKEEAGTADLSALMLQINTSPGDPLPLGALSLNVQTSPVIASNSLNSLLPSLEEWPLNAMVTMNANLSPRLAGYYSWTSNVPSVIMVANGSNATVTVSACVTVTVRFTPFGAPAPTMEKSVTLRPYGHVCHWGNLTMSLPVELQYNDNDSDSNGVSDCVQSLPASNDPEVRDVMLSYDEGDMLDCCRLAFANPRLTLSCDFGANRIRTWNTAGTQPFTYPQAAPIVQAPWNFRVEGVQYSVDNGDVRFMAHVEFASQPEINQIWATTVLKVRIMQPFGSLDNNPARTNLFIDTLSPYRYDWQAVCANQPGNPTLYQPEGVIAPAAGYGYQWTLPASCGTLERTDSALPLHNAPLSISNEWQDGVLQLDATRMNQPVGIKDQRMIRVYDDHLRRDMANFTADNLVPFDSMDGVMRGGHYPLEFSCFVSASHAYNGTTFGVPILSDWTVSTSVTVDVIGYLTPDLGALQRKDVVAYYNSTNGIMHVQTCTGSGNETWGANNAPLVWDEVAYRYTNAYWTFCTAPAGIHFQNARSNDFPVTIRVLRKPY